MRSEKAVDYTWLPVKARRRVHHAKDTVPRGDAIQITEGALEAAQNGHPCETRGGIGLFRSDFSPDFAERGRKRPIGVGWAVA